MGIAAITGYNAGLTPAAIEARERAAVLAKFYEQQNGKPWRGDSFEQAAKSHNGSVTMPTVAFLTLLSMAAPQLIPAQQQLAANLSATQNASSAGGDAQTTEKKQYADLKNGGILLGPQDKEMPNPKDYVNRIVAFSDGNGCCSSAKLIGPKNSMAFGVIRYEFADIKDKEGKGDFTGIVRRPTAENIEQGYFVVVGEKDGKEYRISTDYLDTARAFEYILEAYNSVPCLE